MVQLLESFAEFAIPFAISVSLLLWGRRLFWILGGLAFALAGVIAFAVIFEPSAVELRPLTTTGFYFDIEFETTPPAVFVVAVVAAVIGIVMTLRFPKLAGGVVGFALGTFFLVLAFQLFAVNLPEWVRRSLILIFATFVAIVALRQPPDSMIILSTLFGANLFVDVTRVDWNSPLSAFVWLLAALVGIIFQTNALRVEQRRQEARELVAQTPSSAPV